MLHTEIPTQMLASSQCFENSSNIRDLPKDNWVDQHRPQTYLHVFFMPVKLRLTFITVLAKLVIIPIHLRNWVTKWKHWKEQDFDKMQVLKRTGFKKIIVIKSEMKSTCSFNLYVEQPLLLDNSKRTCVTFAAYHVTLCSLYYL